MAERLTALVPAGATVARLGGDEFGIVVPFEHAEQCRRPVRARRRAVEPAGRRAGRAPPASAPAPAGRGTAPRRRRTPSACSTRPTWRCTARRTPGADAWSRSPTTCAATTRTCCATRSRSSSPTRTASRSSSSRSASCGPDGSSATRRCPASPAGSTAPCRTGSRSPARSGSATRWRPARSGWPWRCTLHHGAYLAVNLSPRALLAEEVRALLDRDLSHVVVEVTEESDLATEELAAATGWLRDRGARIAMDDTGEGFAGLRRLVQLHPDVVKLDRALVSDVHRHPDKAALVEALVAFCRRTGADLCAEGVETAEEVRALQDLQVAHCQGWLAGRPAAAPSPPPARVRRSPAAGRAECAATSARRCACSQTRPPLRGRPRAGRGPRRPRRARRRVVGGAGRPAGAVHALDDIPSGTYRISDYPATAKSLQRRPRSRSST